MPIQSGQWITPAMLASVTAKLRQTVAQTIANATWTALTFDVEDIDTHAGHSGTSSRWTCPTGLGGTYELTGGVSWVPNATGQRWCRFYKNGVEIEGSGANIDANASQPTLTVARSTLVVLAPGDYVELYAFQSISPANPLATYVAFGYAQSAMNVMRIAS